MIMQSIFTVNQVPVSHREVRWVEKHLSELLSAVEEFKRVLLEVFAPHCTDELHTVKFHLLDHLVQDLKTLAAFHSQTQRSLKFLTC